MVPDGTTMRMDNVQLTYRNFAGKPTNFKKEGGYRSFNIILPEDIAKAMTKDGWNVRTQPGRDEGEPARYLIEVALGYKYKPPRVVTIASRGKTQLDEGMVELLDFFDLGKVDCIIRARHWEMNGNSGVKAWLQSIYAHVIEDELDLEYADIPNADEPPRIVEASEPSEEPPF